MPSHRSVVIFSGGTAANHLVDIFESIRKSKDCPISYIIPISDNGGSSSELIRVFGGPGIGDVRSRLVRLIPRLPEGSAGSREREAIRALFNHRLSSTDARTAKTEWADVVDGTSDLWRDISSAKKELIRSFLNLVGAEIIKRGRPPRSTFDFTSASVGNLFLTGARLFSGSFESAIYLLSSVCGVEDEGIRVIPSINSNFSHHIAAGLEDGTVIVGQNAISHPSPGVEVLSTPAAQRSSIPGESLPRRSSGFDHYYGDEHETAGQGMQHENEEEDANLPGTLPTLRTRNIKFNKDAHLNQDLPARISRIWYINPYGQEIIPPANPRAIQALNDAQAIIYSIGSLYTSLAPSLVLRGIGDALRRNTLVTSTTLRTKILILNGCLDREVGPQPPHRGAKGEVFSAIDFIEAIVRAGEQSRGIAWTPAERLDDFKRSDQPETVRTDSSFLSAQAGISATVKTSPTKSRPALLSTKSEGTIRTTLKSLHMEVPPASEQWTHLYPPPLLASAANSRAVSRDPSPDISPVDAPSSESTVQSNGTADAPASLQGSLKNPISTAGSYQIWPNVQPPNHRPDPIYTHYVTHLIHLPNSPNTPHVDRDLLLSRYGIQCVRVYGRSAPNGEGMYYDHAALRGAIEAIIGRRAEREVQVKKVSRVETRSANTNGKPPSPSSSSSAAAAVATHETNVSDHVLGRGIGVADQEWNTLRSTVRRNTLDG